MNRSIRGHVNYVCANILLLKSDKSTDTDDDHVIWYRSMTHFERMRLLHVETEQKNSV
jgi:hypothetical protein